MSKIVLTEIKKGDALTVDGMNASIAEWNARSNDIDQDNVRQEGVDRRNFAASPVTTEPVSGSPGSRGLVINSTSQLMGDTSPADVPDTRIGVFTYDPSNQVAFKLNLSFEYDTQKPQTSSASSGGYIPPSGTFPIWRVAIYYKDDATMASYEQLPETVRRLANGKTGSPLYTGIHMRGSIGICHNFTTLLTSTTTLNFKLYAWEAGSGTNNHWIRIKNLTFYGTRILR